MKKTGFHILLILMLFGCDNEFDNRCFEKQGEITTAIIPLESYNRIIIWGMFDIYLKQDTTHYMEIETAENLIPYIDTKIKNNTLEIYENINCEWSRKYVRTKLTLHFIDINYLVNWETCYITTIDTLQCNRLHLYARNGLAEMDLTMNTNYVKFDGSIKATGKYKLSGNCERVEITVHNATQLDAGNLKTRYAEIYQNSIADVKANVSDVLDASIVDAGNIVLPAWPDSVNILEHKGKGNILVETHE